jgi:hypothetical protein
VLKKSLIKKEKIMIKRFFYILVLSVFFCNLNCVAGKGPGPEEWKDDRGRTAPPAVRKAADDLWGVVEMEGTASFNAGWSVRKLELSWTCTRIAACLFTCGLNECCLGYEKTKLNEEFEWNRASRSKDVYSLRQQEVSTAFETFKSVVNKLVVRPEDYSGDADICEIGPWIEDGAWKENDNGFVWFASGRRDLSNVTRMTMNFVNSHGGWNIGYGSIPVSLSED